MVDGYYLARAPPSTALTARRHVDLLLVASATCPDTRKPRPHNAFPRNREDGHVAGRQLMHGGVPVWRGCQFRAKLTLAGLAA